MNIEPIKDWLPVAKKKPIVVSGPCSAESREQVIETCLAIAATEKVSVLRAGIWKPRTRPNSFEGVGEVGLKWLREASEMTGLPSVVEVANRQHIELALDQGIDMFWIGARTTVNPFSVQEIADALHGVDIPVFVKNPINPDLQLWIGALERLNNAGITKIAAIHRGFSGFDQTVYRNAPKWNFPIELKRQFPTLPVICDPSHIGGNRELLSIISQKALDLDMDGLMIECHISPDEALSDSKQQITPFRLNEILSDLIVRDKTIKNVKLKTKLEKLRLEIDAIDQEILEMLTARFRVINEIGEEKRINAITILQVERWNQILSTRNDLAEKLGLGKEFVSTLLEAIHKESIAIQTGIMNAKKVETTS